MVAMARLSLKVVCKMTFETKNTSQRSATMFKGKQAFSVQGPDPVIEIGSEANP